MALLASSVAGCGDDDQPDGSAGNRPDRPFGESAIITVVNPVVNEGHTGTVPSEHGTTRSGVFVDAVPGGEATSDSTGLAVVKGIAQGNLALGFDKGPTLPLTVVAAGDVYDLAVAYDGSNVATFDNFPIRYGVGGQIVEFATNAPPADVELALATNANIVFFRNGRYVGDLLITGDDVIFFGEGFSERQVVIEGSVVVKGGGVRIRGFTITGDLTVEGNTFGMSFTVVRGSTDIKGNAVAFLRNGLCGSVTVPSSSASLLDNDGMAPLARPAAPVCP
jgi:hypothetical protein